MPSDRSEPLFKPRRCECGQYPDVCRRYGHASGYEPTPSDRSEPLNGSTCQDCGMPNADGYHPYLHCVIWRAIRQHPEKVLADYGYTRHAE